MNPAAGRNYPPGNIRVSDAERDRAISELGEHFQAGRLDAGEFDERSGLALRAKTGDDLTALLADLPLGECAGADVEPQAGESAPVPGSPSPLPRRGPVAAITAITCMLLALAGVASLLGDGRSAHSFLPGLAPLLITVLILRGLTRGT